MTTTSRTTGGGSRSAAGTGAGTAATVVAIYTAFERGDVPTILAALADDVRWEHWPDNWAQRAGVPYMQARHGREEVAEFFELVGRWTVLDFELIDVIGDGARVVAMVRDSFALPGGARFADDELHLWTFDDGGRVREFRHYLDTAKHIAVAAGEDTTAP